MQPLSERGIVGELRLWQNTMPGRYRLRTARGEDDLRHTLKPPFLIFLGDAARLSDAKTGAGLVQWRRPDCAGELRLTSDTTSVGLPEMTIDQAVRAGVRSLVIGVAPLGGRLPERWLPVLEAAARAGLNLVNGLHDRLTSYPAIAEAAAQSGAELIDLRVPAPGIPVGTGARRSGLRLLTVGTDCAVGKKYSALAITAELQRRGASATFCATGQTGIMISGRGVPLDAVPCDFIAGAIEQLSPATEPDHWDVIEGQGSLFHPSYAGVTLGLIHGAQADALVLCHEAGRAMLDDLPDFPIPALSEAAELIARHARLTNPQARFVGVCLNTAALDDRAAQEVCERAVGELGVPACDPIRHGVGAIADECLRTIAPQAQAADLPR
jgi:uncharacterized NAD-dependent epimerase/dehydratase family protein